MYKCIWLSRHLKKIIDIKILTEIINIFNDHEFMFSF